MISVRKRKPRPVAEQAAAASPVSHTIPTKPTLSQLVVTQTPVAALKPYARNPRRHTDKQIDLLARGIEEFGFLIPVLIDQAMTVVAGHGRLEAAKRLGMATVPTALLDHLTPAQVKAFRIFDNKMAELSDWDEGVLRLEIGDLVELEISGVLEFDVSLTGFDTPEIDILLGGAEPSGPAETVAVPDEAAAAVTRPGDLWILGSHRILCGDALEPASYDRLLGAEKARMVFADPPYNVPIAGHVRTGTAPGHREFAMGVGEMTTSEFRDFLARFIRLSRAVSLDGAIFDVCMDWRHIDDLIAAGKAEGLDLNNLCCWRKTNGGMGSLYRSQHELVAIFKAGKAPHVNNVELGRHGRYRTNVWDYAGVNAFRKGREADLVDHPTVKPTALVADAIRDVSRRGEIVLDPFGGSGSTLLAAEKTGRRARLIELDPLYVDVAIRRWRELTRQEAVLEASGETYADRVAPVVPRATDCNGEAA